ncbi:type VII secretion integral membrane protein EccD [Nocardioides litoris]|uniref:type VII secretion integral membrane protein EccD n=1 Tax=Nocardioides litoris TaxID=1926648 RepID=UPI00111E9694|nr:type VII secretion integral membrane protein EccD [Nocardioides litoris]
MSQAPAGTSGLVRVTVASGTRRVDLVLPGAVPVAELVPELARSVGLLDAATVHGGYRLVTADGQRLAGDAGLVLQGVEDGAVVTVTAGVDVPVPPVYDDVVEAMADVVERQLRPWSPEAGRRTALTSAALLLALGAAALLALGTSLAGAAAAAVAAVLLAGAVVLGRAHDEGEAAVTVAWTAVGYAATAALVVAHDEPLLGERLALAGAAAAAAGLLAVIGLGAGRALLLPAVVVGAVLGAAGLVVAGTGADPDVLLVCLTTFVVLVGSVFPWLALGVTGTRAAAPEVPAAAAATAAAPGPVDPQALPAAVEVDAERVAADARVAHEILLAITVTVGLLLVSAAPLAVGLGLAGTLLAAVACVVVMLRTRQYRAGSEVVAGVVSGVAGLAVVVVTVLLTREEWRPTLAVVLAAGGLLLLALTLVPSGPSLRRGRAGDLLESAALVALVPLLVVAVGVVDLVPA